MQDNNSKLSSQNFQRNAALIGLWSCRALLIIGAVVLFLMGKNDGASSCTTLLVVSFILL